jgi:Rod binding domain-containing protein
MDPLNSLSSSAPLTAAQQASLKKLHDAATALEGVFVGMLFKEMHSTVPTDGIFGKQSNADKTWNDMLDEERANDIAKSGSFGIAKMVESQLRASVLNSSAAVPNLPASINAPTLPPGLSSPPSPLAPPSASEEGEP